MERPGDVSVVLGLAMQLLVNEGDGLAEYAVSSPYPRRFVAFVDVPCTGREPTEAEKEDALRSWRGYYSRCACRREWRLV